MDQKISSGRKILYYLGMGLMVAGGLTFASVFITFAGLISDLKSHSSPDFGFFLPRALSGMGLLFLGGILRGIGARGLAGSGAILDPEQAREDLEPFSRMAGGMLKDALEETDLDLGGTSEKVIMIKCGSCGQLNEEDSKFCQECGKAI